MGGEKRHKIEPENIEKLRAVFEIEREKPFRFADRASEQKDILILRLSGRLFAYMSKNDVGIKFGQIAPERSI